MKNVIRRVKSVKLLNLKLLNKLKNCGDSVSFNIILSSTFYRNDWLTLIFSCFVAIQSGNYWFQLINNLIWFTFVTIFSTELKKQIYMKLKLKILRLQILTCFTFLVLFSKKKTTASSKKKTFRKSCCSWGRTTWYWYRWHWKLRGFTSTFVHQWGTWESRSS